jgi:hypothetical protein
LDIEARESTALFFFHGSGERLMFSVTDREECQVVRIGFVLKKKKEEKDAFQLEDVLVHQDRQLECSSDRYYLL